jgi:hypothetical protein
VHQVQLIEQEGSDMKHFIVMVALAGLTTTSITAGAMPRQHCDCIPTTVSVSVLNELSRPVGNAMDSETGDPRWEHAQAVAERDREYSAVEHKNKGHYDQDYRVASPLIDAQYDIASAEIAQVVLRKVQPAAQDISAARTELNQALQAALPKQRPRLIPLWDQLQRVDLASTLCHGQSRGEDRFQYERLKLALRSEIRTL